MAQQQFSVEVQLQDTPDSRAMQCFVAQVVELAHRVHASTTVRVSKRTSMLADLQRWKSRALMPLCGGANAQGYTRTVGTCTQDPLGRCVRI